MGNDWTDDQKRIIAHSEGDLLVAAAAGSGKTAVLVERIVTMLMDKEHPIDIDHMLVVTFTKAAAAQMRERIGKRLLELLSENPSDERLQSQSLLLHHAKICTIDSFCLGILREFFHTIDLDPLFRLGDEAEMKLLQSDVMEELLEECYEEARPSFLSFVEQYASGKKDEKLEEAILSLFQFAMSFEWPKETLEELSLELHFESEEDFFASSLIKDIVEITKKDLSLAHQDLQKAEAISFQNGLKGFLKILEMDKELFVVARKETEYEKLSTLLTGHSFQRFDSREKNVDVVEKERAKKYHGRYKDTVTDLINHYYFLDPKELYLDMQAVEAPMQELICLTLSFMERYEQKKREKNVLEFSDLGHLCLQILLKKEGDAYVPTKVAKDLQQRFDRIMVDEYQDSNRIQESLLWAISRLHDVDKGNPDGKPNIFMVGDVKQSIYRFRLACPELFMEKYDRYGKGNPSFEKIILGKNFRSRPTVLDAVNSIFEWNMHKEFAGIEYDEAAALHLGRSFPILTEESPYDPELVLLYPFLEEKEKKELPSSEEEDEETNKEEQENLLKLTVEARFIAEKIRSLTNETTGLKIEDKGEKRIARFSDIAILLRTAKGAAQTVVNVLGEMGIPAIASVSTGFLSAGEIVTVLNYLKLLDNPRQDIPLAQLLLSPMYQFSNNDLAKIKMQYGKLYRLLLEKPQKDKEEKEPMEEELASRLLQFLSDFRYFQKRMFVLSVEELLREIYQKTGFLARMSAMEAGQQREANLLFLLHYAKDYAATCYHGLFQFVRYVEKRKDFELDFGEASLADASNAVKIMTIHKSKGLEFPIVFLAQMEKGQNDEELNRPILSHRSFGIGADFVDINVGARRATLKKKYIQQKTKKEAIAESLRLLYVAMTRAKDKLFLVGYEKKLKKFFEKCDKDSTVMDDRDLMKATSFLSYIRAIVPGNICLGQEESIEEEYHIPVVCNTTKTTVFWHFHPICVNRFGETVKNNRLQRFTTWEKKKAILFTALAKEEKTKLYEELLASLSYQYPFMDAIGKPLKLTVSELKKRALEEQQEENPSWLSTLIKEKNNEWNEEDKKQLLTNSKKEGFTAAKKGTLLHKVLELLPFLEIQTKDDLTEFLESLIEKGFLTLEEKNAINQKQLLAFLESPLKKRLEKAQGLGKLTREQPFVLGLPCEEDGDDIELVQGIIDLFFEEDGNIILVDYKTDAIKEEKLLVERYKLQLSFYKKALEQILQKTVSEVLIYSTSLQKEIRVLEGR